MNEPVGYAGFSSYQVATLFSSNRLLWDPAQDYRRPVKRIDLTEGAK